MKNLIILITLPFILVSCVVDVPVGGGHPPVIMGGGYGGPQYGPQQCGPQGYIQHGDPRQHVYGNGPQTYIGGFPPPGGYNPNFNYGGGGWRH